MSDREANPISKFFATLLHLGLTVIVIGVVLSMAQAKNRGEEINAVEAASEKTHQVWIDIKKGWSNADAKKDTIK
jgi:hypothetical protein